MELLLGQVLDVLTVLEVLTPQRELFLSASYPLRVLKRDLDAEKAIFNEMREEILIQYAEKDEEGEAIVNDGHYKIADSEAFQKDILELLSQKREFSFNALPVASLGNPRISIEALDKLIECGVVLENHAG